MSALAEVRAEIREGRLQRTMALVTAFSALVSGFEAYSQHLRGAFDHWLMWTPVWLTPPTVLAAAAALVSRRAARVLLPAVSLISLADGLIGFAYHLRGIARMPGGFGLGRYNVVIGPPIFAPLLTCTVGVSGLLAAFMRRERLDADDPIPRSAPPPSVIPRSAPPSVIPRSVSDEESRPRRLARTLVDLTAVEIPRFARNDIGGARHGIGGTRNETGGAVDTVAALTPFVTRIARGRFQRLLAFVAAGFAVLAGGEAYFEHLRGSFNQTMMWTPIWLTPPMAAAAVGSAWSERVAIRVLPWVSVATFLDGVLGFLLHLRGIKRMPGHFLNLQFNITMGPPLFAPLLLSLVGLMGLVASLLRRSED